MTPEQIKIIRYADAQRFALNDWERKFVSDRLNNESKELSGPQSDSLRKIGVKLGVVEATPEEHAEQIRQRERKMKARSNRWKR